VSGKADLVGLRAFLEREGGADDDAQYARPGALDESLAGGGADFGARVLPRTVAERSDAGQ
jgi:hypothetical protein